MNKITNPFRIKSLLFIPAIKESYFDKVLEFKGDEKPDGIIFDLEDSVGEQYKNDARKILFNRLVKDMQFKEKISSIYKIFVRINGLKTKWFSDDLNLIKKIAPDFLMLSKIEEKKELILTRKKSKDSQLFVVIESIKGFRNREKILGLMKPSDLFAIGYEDLSSELLIERPDDLSAENPITKILMDCIISVRERNVIIIDAVSRKFGTPENLEQLEKECQFTLSLGLTGKVAVHPSQVPIINKVFNKEVLLKKAEEVLAQFKELKNGSSVIVRESKEMNDMPSYKMYKKLLELWSR
ncbi:MAG: aldolase/citrate lyase family protein [Candidatus Pacebacteria bacterium]|nr:aldolase/citrate lyase family protein [Candidatus Paceibacterota bacterium]